MNSDFKLIACATGLLIALFVVLLVLASIFMAPTKANFESATAPLVEAKEVTLYSLEGIYRSKPAAENLHGYIVLGKVNLAGSEANLATAAFQAAMSHGSRLPTGLATCFEPHHAIEVVAGNHTYDYLLCYICSQVEIYKDNEMITDLRTSGSPTILNQILASHHVKIAPEAQEK